MVKGEQEFLFIFIHILNVPFHSRRQRSLFHVLHCLSLHCEQCGYCQGMGPIAATLLCYFAPERVYASLVRIHDAYKMHDIFSPGFPGLLEAIYVQERIMEQTMPAVYAAFKKHMISTTSYATKWYITLFANSVPFQAQLRLWDAFLLEGHDVFVVVAVAIVWVYRGKCISFLPYMGLCSNTRWDETQSTIFIMQTTSHRNLQALKLFSLYSRRSSFLKTRMLSWRGSKKLLQTRNCARVCMAGGRSGSSSSRRASLVLRCYDREFMRVYV